LIITEHTTFVGLIGWPVSHSVSPAMHNAAFEQMRLDWRYLLFPVATEPAERIGDAVRGLRALGLRGANVTVPHKQNVIAHLDRLTISAQAIGAVNTIIVDNKGLLIGDNTDAPGFIADLRANGVEPAGLRTTVLGAGGAARAVVYGLAEAGASEIAVFNRSPDRAYDLVVDMRNLFPQCRLSAHELPGGIARVAPQTDLIVNCTTLGMTPRTEELPWDEATPFASSHVVYDLVYNPMVTRLLDMAAADGARTVGGLGMLVWQAALAFERWTGKMPDVKVMWSAALERLDTRR
jgi:shikimate dehydrogenase